MKLVTQHICPPIPIRSFDWAAYFDGQEDGPTGHGVSEQDALIDLLWQTTNAEEERLVQQYIDVVEAA